MTRRSGKTAECDSAAARVRLRQAESFVSVAESVLAEPADGNLPLPGVAAALAVLAGIAASDAACCSRLGRVHRGPDHADAIDLVRTVEPDGKQLANDLTRLLAIKDDVHYGAIAISAADASAAVNRARRMVNTARDIVI
jgi:hypothetical protein